MFKKGCVKCNYTIMDKSEFWSQFLNHCFSERKTEVACYQMRNVNLTFQFPGIFLPHFPL